MLNLPPLEALLAFHGLLTDPIIAALSKAAQSGKAAPSLSAQPVSYTHLDVYKRQNESMAQSFLKKRLGKQSAPRNPFIVFLL